MTTLALAGSDGVELAAVEWPGASDRSVLAVHATGFCKEVWDPVAAPLSASGVRFVAFDQRGHGSSSPPPDADWWGLGADAATAGATLGPFEVGSGHSSGATAITMAAVMHPGLFRSLVVIEPVIFPPGADYPVDLADRARGRRDSFASLVEARDHFEGRGLFAGWVTEALDGYLRGGLRCGADGCELACPVELEAGFYQLGMSHGVWDRLDELALPVRLLFGEGSGYHDGSAATALARRMGAELQIVPDANHFLPMQQPQVVATAVSEMLGA